MVAVSSAPHSLKHSKRHMCGPRIILKDHIEESSFLHMDLFPFSPHEPLHLYILRMLAACTVQHFLAAHTSQEGNIFATARLGFCIPLHTHRCIHAHTNLIRCRYSQAKMQGCSMETSAARPVKRQAKRATPSLRVLSSILLYYDHSTPLAFAVAHPVCRFTSESRGVYDRFPSQPSLMGSRSAYVSRTCDPSLSYEATNAHYRHEKSGLLLWRHLVAAKALTQPLLQKEVYDYLSRTRAGLRIGHTLSFLLPLTNEGSTVAFHEQVTRWQAQVRSVHSSSLLMNAASIAGEHPHGNEAEEWGDGHGRREESEDSIAAVAAGAPMTGEWVRVLILFGEARIAARMSLAQPPTKIHSRSSSASSSSAISSDCSIKAFPASDSRPITMPHEEGLTLLQKAHHCSTATRGRDTKEEEEEGERSGRMVPRTSERKRARSDNKLGKSEALSAGRRSPDLARVNRDELTRSASSAEIPEEHGAIAAEKAVESNQPAAQAGTHPVDRVSHANSDHESDNNLHLSQLSLAEDWEVEAAAAEAAEAAVAAARERERLMRRLAEPLPAAPSSTTAVPVKTVSDTVNEDHTHRASLIDRAVHRGLTTTTNTRTAPPTALFAAARTASRPFPEWSAEPPPRDTAPLCAWWLNRPSSLLHTNDTKRTMPLCVHVHYGYPQWLDWLAGEVDPRVLLSLALSFWPYDGRRLRPSKKHYRTRIRQQDCSDEGIDSRIMAKKGKRKATIGGYHLPLRAFSHEAGSATAMADVACVVAAPDMLETLRLQYFTTPSVLLKNAVKESQSCRRRYDDKRGRLYCSLRRVDFSYSEVSSAGLMDLLANTTDMTSAMGAGKRMSVSAPPPVVQRNPTLAWGEYGCDSQITELILSGCTNVTDLCVCAYLPHLRVLDVQGTGVTDHTFDKLLLHMCERMDFHQGSRSDMNPSTVGIFDANGMLMREDRKEKTGDEEVQCVHLSSAASDMPDDLVNRAAQKLSVGTSLEDLHLCHCTVNLGLASIARCFPCLRLLDLRSTPVTEAGLEAFVSASTGGGGGGGGSESTTFGVSTYHETTTAAPVRAVTQPAHHTSSLQCVIVDRCTLLTSLSPLWTLHGLRVVSAELCSHLTQVGHAQTSPQTAASAFTAAPRTAELMELRLQGCLLLSGYSLGAMAGYLGMWTLTRIVLDDTAIGDDTLRLLCGLSESGGGNGGVSGGHRVNQSYTNPSASAPSFFHFSSEAPHGMRADGSSRRCEALTYLSLRQCRGLRSLGPLGTLPSLTTLIASGCGVEDSGLPHLSVSRSLKVLDLSYTDVKQITPLAYLSDLRSLNLSNVRRLCDESLIQFVFAPSAVAIRVATVPTVPAAQSGRTGGIWGFSSVDIGDGGGHGARRVGRCEREAMKTAFNPIQPSVYDSVAAAPSLRYIDLSGCQSIRFVGCLAHLPALVSLRLNSTTVFDASLYGFFARKQALLAWRNHDDEMRAEEVRAVRRFARGVGQQQRQEQALNSRDRDTTRIDGVHRDRAPLAEGRHDGGRIHNEEAVYGAVFAALTNSGNGGGDFDALRGTELDRIPDLEELRVGLERSPSGLLLPSAPAIACLREVSLGLCSHVRAIEPLGLLPMLRSLDVSGTAVDSTSLRGFVQFHVATVLAYQLQVAEDDDSGKPEDEAEEEEEERMVRIEGTCVSVTQARVGLEYLSIASCKYITDVGCLVNVPTLCTLDASMSFVEEHSLETLVAGRQGYVATLSLQTRQENSLDAASTRGEKANRFQRPMSLRSLYLSGCPYVCNIRCLLYLPTLRELHLSYMPHTVDEDIVDALRDSGVEVTV